MIYVFKQPSTPAEAMIELDKLADEATEVMMPNNRRRLGQRSNTLNSHYDQIQLKANLHANRGETEWQPVAERVTQDKKILSGVKEKMQIEGIQLY